MTPPAQRAGLRELATVFLRLSLLGFGGPNAHIALMLDELVERRRWIDREHFLHLLGITHLLPGPNSTQVAIQIGYTRRGIAGALTAGLAFSLPTLALVLALAAAYFRYGRLPTVEPFFHALEPAVVAIILAAGWRLATTAARDLAGVVLALAAAALALLADGWEPAALAVGAVVGLLIYRDPPVNRPGNGPGPGPEHRTGSRTLPAILIAPFVVSAELTRIFLVTFYCGAVLFGGGYMLIALLEPLAVGRFGWLTPGQFLDGVALTQAVPGPIVTLVAFVGYGAAGVAGGLVAALGIYIPTFASVLAVAPWLDHWRGVAAVRRALRGVNAAVAGAIVGVGVSLVPAAVGDVVAAALLVAALALLLFRRLPAIWIIAGALVIGFVRALTG